MFEQSIPTEARPAFCLKPTESSVKMWCMFKDGKPYGTPCRTKRDLLIGYDLMPLHGLRKCERLMAARGITAHECAVSTCYDSPLLAVSLAGELQPDSVSWSVPCNHETRLRQIAGASFNSACGWVAKELELSQPDDSKVLSRWSWTLTDYKRDRWVVKDKRRASTTRNLIRQCADIFQRCGYRIIPIRISQSHEPLGAIG